MTAAGAQAGPDGLLRCPWSLGAPSTSAYHDDEWGRPVRDDTGLFERLCLEAFQSGLSWLTILRKREGFRAAFAGFDIAAVAAFGPDDVRGCSPTRASSATGPRSMRSSATRAPRSTLPGGLAELVWAYAGGRDRAPRTLADVPASTPASKALAKELKRHGFSFTGPVTAYATLQACGVVDDHLADCFRRDAYGS